jgi:hypothetical protein
MLSTPWRRIARLAKSNARSMSIGGRPMGRPFFFVFGSSVQSTTRELLWRHTSIHGRLVRSALYSRDHQR